MTTAAEPATAIRIRLEANCGCPGAAEQAWQLRRQLAGPRYRDAEMSVLPLDPAPVDYFAELRTASKRARRAFDRGYRVQVFERADHAADVNAINRSLPERQGRPMDAAYLRDQTFEPVGPPACPRHRVTQYGVFARRGRLVAYTVIHRVGELALVSQILGHGDHLGQGVIQLLFAGVYLDEHATGGWLVYNRHDSGTEGLRQSKEWQRFRPMRVDWTL